MLAGVVYYVYVRREDVKRMRAWSEPAKSHQWKQIKENNYKDDLTTLTSVLSNEVVAMFACRQPEVG